MALDKRVKSAVETSVEWNTQIIKRPAWRHSSVAFRVAVRQHLSFWSPIRLCHFVEAPLLVCQVSSIQSNSFHCCVSASHTRMLIKRTNAFLHSLLRFLD